MVDESLPCLGQLIVFDIEVGIDRVSGRVSLYQGVHVGDRQNIR